MPIALLAWAVYSAAAVWMTECLHLEIGDSMSRMADARAMLFSRDPHLAAIGLYWMPLPTVGQLPFMLILSPLRHAELSGPLACAFVGAVGVVVMAEICWVMGLSRRLAIALTLAYAFNPIVVYTNGNGMSEAWLFCTLAVAMLGFLRWSRYHRTVDLAILGVGLALVALTRYEGFVLAPVLAVIAALNDGKPHPRIQSSRLFLADCGGRWRRWLTTALVIVVPTYFVLALWMLMNYVIARNPLYWYDLQKATGHTTRKSYSYLPAHHPIPIVGYVLQMILAVIPALVVIGPLLLLRRKYHDFLTGLGILAGAAVWPLIVLVGIFVNESAGAPRYFEPTTVFIAVGAIWLAASPRPKAPTRRRTLAVALVGVLVLGAVAGTVGLENPARTGTERENQFFSRILGHHLAPLPADALSEAQSWKTLARALDAKLTPGNKVLVDVSAQKEASAFVFTRYPSRYIVNSDRDYERIVADTTGQFDFLLLALPQGGVAAQGDEYDQFKAIVTTTTGGTWVKWRTFNVAIVYQFVPAPSGQA